MYLLILKRGNTYILELVPGFYNYSATVHWAVYADWNQDNDFYDTGEFLARGSSYKKVQGSIKIPNIAHTGSIRLRVIMQKGYAPDGPCSQLTDGETEDYCIKLQTNNVKEGSLKNESSLIIDDAVTLIETNNNLMNSNLEIIPNPAVSDVSFHLVGVQKYQISNMAGQIIEEMHVNSSEYEYVYNVDHLKNGIYLIRAYLEDGSVQLKKMIKLQ